MRRANLQWTVVMGFIVAGGFAALAQLPASSNSSTPASSATSSTGETGGRLHGTVKSGTTALPGVTVTAQNKLTGKKFSTTTDLNGAWSLNLAQEGHFLVRTQFAGFATGSQEAVLTVASHDQTVNIDLMLSSRAAELAKQQDRQSPRQTPRENDSVRQMAGNGAQNLNLTSSLSADTETQTGSTSTTTTGATLPSIATNSDFSSDSVAITGQSGTVSAQAGVGMDQFRDSMQTMSGPGGMSQQAGNFAGGGGGLFGGGGFGGGGVGGFGRRGNFSNFNSNQPHGTIFWSGSNSALDAQSFSVNGQSKEQPSSGTNRFGFSFMSAPYIPGLFKASGKDTVYLSYSGSRSSSPINQNATVPTDAERAGTIAGLSSTITPVSQATALLKYFPEPNLSGTTQNYQLLSTSQSNSTQIGARYMRSLGKVQTNSRRRMQSQGLSQSVSFNYNWSNSASDNVNIFPELGGKNTSESNSLTASYSLSYHKISSSFSLGWNRGTNKTTNNFTNGSDIATSIGILGADGSALNVSPLNYGLPNIVLSNYAGMSEQQPSFSTQQTISMSETLSWRHGKHNMRFGGDYRRVHDDFLGGSNSTGTFYFTGLFTGSSLGDFLLGQAQETTIDVAAGKSYLREHVFDLFAQDDWRVRSNLTLNYGIRYEFFAPYTENNGHLSFVDTNPKTNTNFTALFGVTDEVQAGGTGSYNGKLPDSLVYPFRVGIAPRLGVALRLSKKTVVRAGYGMNFTNAQYSSFASTMARQPMARDASFVNEQTNQTTTAGALTLAKGFGSPDTVGNYAIDPHYRLPYVQVWNVDLQKTLPWGVVLNLGYNGSKGSNLDITSAPRASTSSPLTNPSNLTFNYEQSGASSRFNAGTVRVNKRMSGGVSVGGNYQYSHSIDNASSVGGNSTVVAQNWQDLGAEKGNSSFDQRHKISGTYTYELPFGKDKLWLSEGLAARLFEGFTVTGNYSFASGTQLTPRYQAATSSVTCGTAGSLRPDRNYAESITAGGGTLKKWFNTSAFSQPVAADSNYPCDVYGTAARNSITGPGTVQNNMSLSRTVKLSDTRSMELRAIANNVFNTVQYSGVDTNVDSLTFGQVTSAASMRQFSFSARFRY
jgi:trimeric autotransporter adhesin